MEERDDFDANTFQLLYNSKQGWSSQLNILTGNLLYSSPASTKNLVFQYSQQKQNSNKNKRRNWKFLNRNNDDENRGSLYKTLRFILKILVTSAPMLLLLVGYILYRYMYLQKREQKLDFVDMALLRRF